MKDLFLVTLSLVVTVQQITALSADCPHIESIIQSCTCTSPVDRPDDIVVYCKGKGLTEMPVINGTYGGEIYEFTLADNQISYLPDNAFQDLNIKRVDLSKNNLRNVSEKAFQGMESSLTVLKLTGDATNRAEIPFSAIRNLRNLQELSLQNFLSSSPDLENSTYFQPFTSLLKLTLDNLGIQSISSTVFIGLTSLQDITIKETLESFPGGALQNRRNTLEMISITNTKITSIQQYSFDGMNKLKSIDFSSNQIITLEAGCFIGVENNLESLILDKNLIPANQLEEVQKLAALKVLSLQNIGLDNLTPTQALFQNKTNLVELKLAENRLTTIPNNVFKDLVRLRKLELSLNQINTMEENSLAGLTSLEILNLDSQSGGPLSLPSLSSLPSLTTLILDHTVISKQSWTKISEARSLSTLRMVQGHIAVIPPFTFKMMKNLQYLDLSDNNIENINQETFVGPTESLKKIYLNHNPIQTFDSCTFHNYSGNISLEFYGNPFRCDCALYWLMNAVNDGKILLNELTTCSYPPNLDGRPFTSLQPSELCTSQPAVPSCTDYYSTTTTTTATTTTTKINIQINVIATDITINSITISWTITKPESINHVIVASTDMESHETEHSRQLDPLLKDYKVSNLKSGRRYQFCVDAYKADTIVHKECRSYATLTMTTTTDPNIDKQTSNNNELGIIIGSVIGALVLFGILVAIIYLMFVRKNQHQDKYAVEPRSFTKAELPTVGYDSKRYRKKKKDETDGNKNNVSVTVISDGKSAPNVGRASVGSYQYLQDNKGVSGQPNPGYQNDAAAKLPPSHYENDQSLRPLPQMPRDSAGYYNPSFRNSTAEQGPHTYSEIKL